MATRVERAEALLERARERASDVHRAGHDLFSGTSGLPEVDASDLTVDAIASGVQHHGGLVVRRLIRAELVTELREFAQVGVARARWGGRSTVATDQMVATLVAVYETEGVLDLVERYLGDHHPIGFPQRTVIKRNEKSRGLPWHQDASFFGGPCGALDVWTALTPCGKDCPSLSLVPQRVDRVLDRSQTTVDGSSAVEKEVVRLLDETEPARPVLSPGDAILLDEMTVHRTGTGWTAPFRDVAVTWFFAPSRVPRMNAKPIAF